MFNIRLKYNDGTENQLSSRKETDSYDYELKLPYVPSLRSKILLYRGGELLNEFRVESFIYIENADYILIKGDLKRWRVS